MNDFVALVPPLIHTLSKDVFEVDLEPEMDDFIILACDGESVCTLVPAHTEVHRSPL